MTMGQLMVYGGLALIGIGVLAICLFIPIFSRQRKKLGHRIMEEYDQSRI